MSRQRSVSHAVRTTCWSGHASRSLVTRDQLYKPRRQYIHYDGRNRLSNFWTATTDNQNESGAKASTSSNDLLIKCGFVQQAHSGIFHLLPLGLRVQDKLERLIDKHMCKLGASKVSLSSISSEALWRESGRLEGRDSEFFRLEDRKGKKFLLSPTHEEEITSIVRSLTVSHKQLPLRLYQVSRKYRDEARPRRGLMRGREFLMKDLYTFDTTDKEALATYEDVRKAYSAFLDELGLPYVVAAADSGNMGGNLSHEYHFISSAGEDIVLQCTNCGYAANEEIYIEPYAATETSTEDSASLEPRERIVHGVSKDKTTLIKVVIPADTEVNWPAVKQLCPGIDSSIEDPHGVWEQHKKKHSSSTVTLIDPRLSAACAQDESRIVAQTLLTQAQSGSTCLQCSKKSLEPVKAVEIGHTFHLGTRYSEALGAKVSDQSNQHVAIQMGCHGIGVTRLIGAIADITDGGTSGPIWPLAIAPFNVFIRSSKPAVSGPKTIESVYDELLEKLQKSRPDMDAIIADTNEGVSAAVKRAGRMGCTFVVILGRAWFEKQEVELHCRHLKHEVLVRYDELASKILQLAEQM